MTYKWFTSWFNIKRQHDDNVIDYRNHEPLDHPELARMTLAELADLPMPAYVKENCSCNVRII
jgi:hypothetical protein